MNWRGCGRRWWCLLSGTGGLKQECQPLTGTFRYKQSYYTDILLSYVLRLFCSPRAGNCWACRYTTVGKAAFFVYLPSHTHTASWSSSGKLLKCVAYSLLSKQTMCSCDSVQNWSSIAVPTATAEQTDMQLFGVSTKLQLPVELN